MEQILYIKNASQLITMEGHSEAPAKKERMSDIGVIENGSVLAKEGKIIAVGKEEDIRAEYTDEVKQARIIEATGKVVSPGLVDPHTHLVHAGTRENEYAMRLQGKTYMEIMNAGGGIHATTRATQAASLDELYEQSRNRMDRFLLNGVTTIEAKSGYGLTLEDELKQLEVAKKLNEDHALDLVSTLMGAHAVPVAEKDNTDGFVERVIKEMIPEVAEKCLAEFIDVFCERGVFTTEKSRRILEAGKDYGRIPKIHDDDNETCR